MSYFLHLSEEPKRLTPQAPIIPITVENNNV